MFSNQKLAVAACVVVALSFALISRPANAVPSFSLQTGQACSVCHIGSYGPALTPFGRAFKIGGYTFATPSDDWKSKIPLSLGFMGSYNQTAADLPADMIPHHYAANNNPSFDEVTGWIAGRISNYTGGFIQITHSGTDGTTFMDMADLRPFTSTFNLGGREVRYGFSVNNQPTIQDAWNSIPTGQYPYVSSSILPTPAASPMLDSGFMGNVFGTTAYVWIGGQLYLEAGTYNTMSPWLMARIGNGLGIGSTNSPAPYVRATYDWAWNKQTAHLGGIFMHGNVNPPNGIPFQSTGAFGADTYNDYAVDGGYTYLGNGTHIVDSHAIFIHEQQNLTGSAGMFNSANGTSFGPNYTLNEIHASVAYWYENTYGFTVGWQREWGPVNPILFQPGELTGSANSKPNSNAFIFEVGWVPFGKPDSWLSPWVNLELGLQYTLYTEFNGGSKNYDGSGRNASDNNSIFAYARLVF